MAEINLTRYILFPNVRELIINLTRYILFPNVRKLIIHSLSFWPHKWKSEKVDHVLVLLK